MCQVFDTLEFTWHFFINGVLSEGGGTRQRNWFPVRVTDSLPTPTSMSKLNRRISVKLSNQESDQLRKNICTD